MGSEIVKYHNDMNKVSFAGFKEKELDLFFSICQKMKDKGTSEIVFSFSDLRKISQYSNRSIDRFYLDLDRVYKKMLELNLRYEDEKEIRRFVLFSRYIIKKDEQIIIIKASEDFEYILNKLIGTFTKFDLVDFVSLKSIYSKNMFKLLKQWDSNKKIKFEIIELKNILGVPPKYTTSNFNDRVLKPIMEELPNYFYNLKLEKIKTGRKITHLKFTWSNKKQEIKDVEKIEIEISEKLNRSIQKAKKNRFIEKLFNNENIEILVNSFNEIDLIKGLNWSYKEIKQEINSLNYLIKSIKTGIEKTEKKIVVKEDIKEVQEPIIEKNSQVILENPKIEIPEKIIVTQNEYEEIYKNHLKENNMIHNKFTRLAFDKSTESKYEIVLSEEDRKKERDIDDDDDYKPPMWHDELSEPTKRQILRQKNNNQKKSERTEFLETYTKHIKNYLLDLLDELRVLEESAINRLRNRKRISEVVEEIELIKNYLDVFEEWKYRYILKNYTNIDYFDSMLEIRGIKTKDVIDLFNILIEQLNHKELIITKELIENWIVEVAHGDEYGFNIYGDRSEEEIKNMIKFEDIPEEQLLSKTGKVLTGGALESRLHKIAKEFKKLISYKNKIIG
ncbi:replication initiation protein [uncultured Cetobacterium sp.]|uniref:replication initiation protein n=1 Tax=uncultured Cetobacterium sp. TaxID=527638 RepID=UPI00262BFAF7|nr:replication initiation protein [uncultured Cetobacterium sp.]